MRRYLLLLLHHLEARFVAHVHIVEEEVSLAGELHSERLGVGLLALCAVMSQRKPPIKRVASCAYQDKDLHFGGFECAHLLGAVRRLLQRDNSGGRG